MECFCLVRHRTPFIALLIALVSLGSHQAAAQEGWPVGEVLPDGPVTVGRDWAELVFPPLALSNTGCPHAYSYPPQEPMRRYGWGAQTRFRDATARVDHFTDLYVLFELPDRVPITDARLDSALAAAHITVKESRGEPPMPISIVIPRLAWARREGRSVRIRVEGKEAVEALLRPRSDSIDINWCRREDTTTFVLARRTKVVRQ